MKQFDRGKKVSNELGDFTTTTRLLKISALALGIGAVSAFVAFGLLKSIALFTHIFFYQRIGVDGVQPAGHHLGPLVIVVPIIGGLIIGLMAAMVQSVFEDMEFPRLSKRSCLTAVAWNQNWRS